MNRVGSTLLLAVSLLSMTPLAVADEKTKKEVAAVPEEQSAKKACENATGQTKIECEKVAAKIDANTAEPRRGVERDELSTDDVRHSSAVVAKPDRERADKVTNEKPAASAPKSAPATPSKNAADPR